MKASEVVGRGTDGLGEDSWVGMPWEMSCQSLLISARNSVTLEEIGAGGGGATARAGKVTDVTLGIVTSMILSAMPARVPNETLSPDEARTIRTWLGSR